MFPLMSTPLFWGDPFCKLGKEDYGSDAAEGMLCDTREEHVHKIFDVIMKGQ
jgi:hypothetical protein